MEKISPHKYVYSFYGIINLICMVNVVCSCKQNRLAKPFFFYRGFANIGYKFVDNLVSFRYSKKPSFKVLKNN